MGVGQLDHTFCPTLAPASVGLPARVCSIAPKLGQRTRNLQLRPGGRWLPTLLAYARPVLLEAARIASGVGGCRHCLC
jgi:hypothetical protein